RPMKGLEGKVALVTGAARKRGIGRAIALRLGQEGCDVVVSAIGRDPSTFPEHEQADGWLGLASVVADIEALGRRGLAVDGDVADKAAVQAMVDAALPLGGLDIVVNNAALPSEAGAAPIADMDD